MNKSRNKTIIAPLCVLAWVLIAGNPLFAQMGSTTPAPMNTQTTGSLTISGYWVRMAAQVGGVSAAYMEIRSAADTDTLVRAESAVAKVVELHETTMSGGVMAMSPVPSMAVPAKGGALVLKPAGLHVMLIDLKKPLMAGDIVELDLYFQHAGKVTLKLPVLAP